MKTNDIVQFNENHKWCGCFGIVDEVNGSYVKVEVRRPEWGTAFIICEVKDLKVISNGIVAVEISNDSVLPICAVRYAMGRMTYMPKMVVDELIPLIPYLSDRNLTNMGKDLAEYLAHSKETEWKTLYKTIINEQVKRVGEKKNDE